MKYPLGLLEVGDCICVGDYTRPLHQYINGLAQAHRAHNPKQRFKTRRVGDKLYIWKVEGGITFKRRNTTQFDIIKYMPIPFSLKGSAFGKKFQRNKNNYEDMDELKKVDYNEGQPVRYGKLFHLESGLFFLKELMDNGGERGEFYDTICEMIKEINPEKPVKKEYPFKLITI